MAETANLAKMAEKLSQELFSEFLWKQCGPMNCNWACEEKELHNSKTHPSDIVFWYDEPYTNARTYMNCDLKSYAKGTINAGVIKAAIESLARALTCAEKSIEWRDKYIHNHVSAEICGLLFVYNHDGAYDSNFKKILNGVEHQKLEIPSKSKIVVLGPDDIFWLSNVCDEIVRMRGKKELPDQEHCHFYYPHLVRKKNVQLEQAKAATLEMLTSPWIMLSYINPSSSRKGYVIFYRRGGEEISEFLYLIDCLAFYQMLTSDNDIHIKILNPQPNAQPFFQKAKDQYIDQCGGSIDLKHRLNAVSFDQMTNVRTTFSEIQIGMEYAKE
jgi:hypothetical protein